MDPPVSPRPLLVVADVARARAFYSALLGAEAGHGGDEYEQLRVAGRVVLQLHRRGVDHHHGPLGVDGAPPGDGVLVWFAVEDLDGAVRRGRAHGPLEVVREVHVNPNAGLREWWVRDPDGYLVVVADADRA